MENDVNEISLDIIENSITGELGAISANIGNNLMKSLNNSNNFYKCLKSGSKGSQIIFFKLWEFGVKTISYSKI